MWWGKWLSSKVTGYVPRNCATGDKWTHWQLLIKRERYNDCAIVSVEVFVYMARRKREHWIVGRKIQIYHRVDLGLLSDNDVRRRLTNDDSNNPKVKHLIESELQTAFDKFKEISSRLSKGRGYIDTFELTRCIWNACMKKD